MAGFLEEELFKLNAKAKMDCKVSSPGWHLENRLQKHRPPWLIKTEAESIEPFMGGY